MKKRKNMLKKSFSIFCLLFFAFSVSAQEGSESGKQGILEKIEFGAKVGTTLSSFTSQQPHNNYKPGLIAGGFFAYKLTSDLALQTEPSYMQQGGSLIEIFDPAMLTMDYPFSQEVRNHNITFHNVDIPVLVKYGVDIKGLKVFAVVGPTISMNFSAIAKTTVTGQLPGFPAPVYTTFHSEENITSNIKFLQYGATGGLGFETPIGNHTLIFDLKYRYSINKTYLGYSYLNLHQVQGDLSSNTFYFTLGFGF